MFKKQASLPPSFAHERKTCMILDGIVLLVSLLSFLALIGLTLGCERL